MSNGNTYENVSEYWFLDHYRVLVVKTNDNKYFVSVDVYRRKWPFNDFDDEICVSNNKYCIVYKEISELDKLNDLDINVDKIIITGVKVGDHVETVNVRWVLEGELKYSVVEGIFYKSWKLIGCGGPRDDPWFTNCPEEQG
jgi:hypothetical protein